MVKRLNVLFFVLLISAVLCKVNARAQEASGTARIGFIQGPVSIIRGNPNARIFATLNAPLVNSDSVITGPMARAEVYLSNGDLLRIDANSAVQLVNLETDRLQAFVMSGTMTVDAFPQSPTQVELNTPTPLAIAAVPGGLFRISTGSDGSSAVTVRAGIAQIMTPSGWQQVGAGQTILARASANGPQIQTIAAFAKDNWDRWNEARDAMIAPAPVATAPIVPVYQSAPSYVEDAEPSEPILVIDIGGKKPKEDVHQNDKHDDKKGQNWHHDDAPSQSQRTDSGRAHDPVNPRSTGTWHQANPSVVQAPVSRPQPISASPAPRFSPPTFAPAPTAVSAPIVHAPVQAPVMRPQPISAAPSMPHFSPPPAPAPSAPHFSPPPAPAPSAPHFSPPPAPAPSAPHFSPPPAPAPSAPHFSPPPAPAPSAPHFSPPPTPVVRSAPQPAPAPAHSEPRSNPRNDKDNHK